MHTDQEVEGKKGGHGTDHGQDFVTVTIDTRPKQIHRGSYIGAKLKEALGVDASKELDQLIEGQLQPVPDDKHVVIKGGEQFVSHQRTGGSS